MIAAAGATGVGEDEDPLVAAHERVRFQEVRARGAVLDLLPPIRPGNEPTRAPGYLGDTLHSEALDQRVERCPDRRQRA
jgi:hypothetical protein